MYINCYKYSIIIYVIMNYKGEKKDCCCVYDDD